MYCPESILDPYRGVLCELSRRVLEAKQVATVFPLSTDLYSCARGLIACEFGRWVGAYINEAYTSSFALPSPVFNVSGVIDEHDGSFYMKDLYIHVPYILGDSVEIMRIHGRYNPSTKTVNASFICSERGLFILDVPLAFDDVALLLDVMEGLNLAQGVAS